jgi:hypothetical protein
MQPKRYLISALVVIFIGPVILLWAKYGLDASLLDGIGNSYSNSPFQENMVGVGVWAVLIGAVIAPFLSARYLRGRLSSGLLALAGMGIFVAPIVLYFVIFSLPS